jgi:hypothetical protein
MRLFHGMKSLAMLFFPLIAVEMVSAAPPDVKLLSLVPPGTQLVAGASNQRHPGVPESFILTGRYNLIDRRDFLSLAGVDDSMRIGQMIFAAGGSDPSRWGEHSILVSGIFNQERIFKAAVQNGATVTEFKGVRILVQQPFARELDTIKDVRWLAVLDSKVALFGTSMSVKDELGRYLDRTEADPSLAQKVSRLRADNATWSVLGAFDVDVELEHVFSSLDPVLANLIHDRKSFQFGVRYGRKVELEYDAIAPSTAPAQPISNFSGQSLLPRQDPAGVHGVLKFNTAQYKAWLEECSKAAILKSGN